MTNEDYGRRIDDVANGPEAQELLQGLAAAADIYFSYLRLRGVYVGSVTVANPEAPKGTGPTISKYIDAASLGRGGSLTSRH